MKTAGEYAKMIEPDMCRHNVLSTLIKQIQLEALKEGVRMAANMAGLEMYKKVILTTSEQLTEKDL